MPKVFLRERNRYILLLILALVLGSVFGVMKGREFFATREALRAMASERKTLQEKKFRFEKKLAENKTFFQNEQRDMKRAALKILPETENHLELTKMLDDFFEKNFEEGNPLIASNLRFEKGSNALGKSYSVLPINLMFTASREKFDAFLDFVEKSGSFEKTGGAARLLDLRTIDMNFGSGDQPKKEISFFVKLFAFYRH